jgi:pimeloyl-ACP methyl ester carboxylesterase
MAAPIRDGQFAQVQPGIKLHYATAGTPGAPLMVFVHGFPEAWFEWEAQLAHFGQRCFAVAPDLRGFNLSSKPAEVAAYRPKVLIGDLTGLIQHLGYDSAVVVAHDWGGALAWNLAIQRPQWVRQLVIINSPHPYAFMRALATDPQQQAASAYMNWLRTPGSELGLAKHGFAALEGFFNGMGQPPAPWFEPLRARYQAMWSVPGENGSHSLTGGVNYYRASPLHPPTDTDPGPAALTLQPQDWLVKRPTLVIWGEQDLALPASLLDGLDALVNPLTIERIPDGGHWVVHEQPERINAAIDRWLAAQA